MASRFGMSSGRLAAAARTPFVPGWLTGRWRFGFRGGLEQYLRQIQDDATLLDIIKQVVSSQEFEIVCAKRELR